MITQYETYIKTIKRSLNNQHYNDESNLEQMMFLDIYVEFGCKMDFPESGLSINREIRVFPRMVGNTGKFN